MDMNGERQFDNFVTFFDIGIEDIDYEQFRILYCVMSETVKKRNNVTKLAMQYLLERDKLTEEEQRIAESILDDSYYNKPSKYIHCKLCSDDFKREVLEDYSNKFKYWEICFPTVPYFPSNMMVYLKNRKHILKEDFQDLTIEELNELKYILNDLQNILNNCVFDGNLVGVNMLFNQISKSQLCIHGHIELMIKNIDKLNYGCSLLSARKYDPVVKVINSQIETNNIIPTLEGIRIDMNNVSDETALNYIRWYENQIKNVIELGKKLRNGKLKVSNDFEYLLLNGMSPVPANSVYLTKYRNKLFLSSVPEVIPPTIDISEVGNLDDAENMYLIKYNATTPNKDYSIMKKYSPLARPSSKVPYEMPYTKNVKLLKKAVKRALTK